jgi:hypothetical protein
MKIQPNYFLLIAILFSGFSPVKSQSSKFNFQLERPRAVALMPDNTSYIAIDIENSFKVKRRSLESGKVLDEYNITMPKEAPDSRMAISPNGKYLAISGFQVKSEKYSATEIVIYDLIARQSLELIDLTQMTVNPISSICFNSNSNLISFSDGSKNFSYLLKSGSVKSIPGTENLKLLSATSDNKLVLVSSDEKGAIVRNPMGEPKSLHLFSIESNSLSQIASLKDLDELSYASWYQEKEFRQLLIKVLPDFDFEILKKNESLIPKQTTFSLASNKYVIQKTYEGIIVYDGKGNVKRLSDGSSGAQVVSNLQLKDFLMECIGLKSEYGSTFKPDVVTYLNRNTDFISLQNSSFLANGVRKTFQGEYDIELNQKFDIKNGRGQIERFIVEDYGTEKIYLWNYQENYLTVFRQVVSTLSNTKYLLFDNHINQGHEIAISEVLQGPEIQRLSWKLVDDIRLSNSNILAVVNLDNNVTRFLIYDKLGKNLLNKTDYAKLDILDILPDSNGGFTLVLATDQIPYKIYNAINGIPEDAKQKYLAALPAFAIAKFNANGGYMSMTAYLTRTDERIHVDSYRNICQTSKSYYLLGISYQTGVLNVPTLMVLKIDRFNPKIFKVQNIGEARNADYDISKLIDKSLIYSIGGEVEIGLTNGMIKPVIKKIASDL